jgi:predicted P-loop ATPase
MVEAMTGRADVLLPGGDPEVLSLLRALGVMRVSKDGDVTSIAATMASLDAILRLDPWLRGQIRHNDLAQVIEMHGQPLTDEAVVRVAVWLEKAYKCRVSAARVHEQVVTLGSENRYHPVVNWLDTLEWDGEPRLARWLHQYLGADDCALHGEYGMRMMISAVARARHPGCKVDTMLILVGGQGQRKSSSIAALCHDPGWYTSTLIDLTDPKGAAERMQGSAIVEIGELSTMRRGDQGAIKQALTTQVDRFRPAYGRCTVSRARACILIGTTNEKTILSDSTGSRRFWPVDVGQCLPDLIERDRDQLWAEADRLYLSGERWWLGEEVEAERSESAQAYERTDPWLPVVESAVRGSMGIDGVDIMSIVADVEPEVGRRTPNTLHRVADCLRVLGFTPGPRLRGSDRRRRWVRVEKV